MGGGSGGALTRTEPPPAVGRCRAKTTVESEVPAIFILTGYEIVYIVIPRHRYYYLWSKNILSRLHVWNTQFLVGLVAGA